MTIRYFRIIEAVRDAEQGDFALSTQAFISCALCGATIDTMGGPDHGAICAPCGEALISGRLRGAASGPEQGSRQAGAGDEA